ncbi:ovostatin-like [Pollicipes pollicipes]|uniref:ovostatin-like n=1 Tax=Pollicipes pollicipes TaxID=41117 RepID=UPI001885558E|nr:ovostatin-like [Pollicipes pollicipes]
MRGIAPSRSREMFHCRHPVMPNLQGRWTIHVKRSDNIVKRPFEVEEYVLPRFEVTITGPKYITNQANTVTLKVCATYTFGKPVPGAALKLLVSRPSTFFFRRRHGSSSEKPPPSNVTFTEETDTDGCVEIDVVLAKIGLGGAVTRRVYASRVRLAKCSRLGAFTGGDINQTTSHTSRLGAVTVHSAT